MQGLIRHKKIIAVSILAVSVLAVYLPGFRNGFVNIWDDGKYIHEDGLVHALTVENVIQIFTTAQMLNYHPLARLTYAIEYHFFGANPAVYHTTNIILHVVNTVLVFWLFMLLYGEVWMAFVVALIFGVHPMHVESVAWVSERRDVLFGLFFIASLIAYAQFLRRGKTGLYVWSLVMFCCSLLSKAMAIPLPGTLFILEQCMGRKTALKTKVPFFVLALLFLGIMVLVRHAGSDIMAAHILDAGRNSAASAWSFVFYIKKFFFPVGLAPLYPATYGDPGSYMPSFGLNAGLVIALVVVLFVLRGKTKDFLLGFLFYAATIAPVLYFLPTKSPLSLVFDRYVYIPAIGLIWAYAVVLKYVIGRVSKPWNKVAIAAGVCLAVALVPVTVRRIKVWKDDVTFWAEAVALYPVVDTARLNYGVALSDAGEYEKAVLLYRTTDKNTPLLTAMQLNTAFAYKMLGDKRTALEILHEIIRRDPACEAAYHNIGNIYYDSGELVQAVGWYRTALDKNPLFDRAYTSLARAYMQLGDSSQARRILEESVQRLPEYMPAYDQLIAYYMKEGMGGRIHALSMAVVGKNIKYFPAYFRLGMDLYEQQKYAEAFGYFKRALLIKRDSALVYAYLGSASYYLGKYEASLRYLRKAKRLDPSLAIAEYNLGMVYVSLKKYAFAEQAIMKARNLGYAVPDGVLQKVKAKKLEK